ncbi:hypothetical protein GOL31_23530 [Sinorhizobium medicae]|nr:hypothetical protein [Sinorhizobium medicae]
MANGLELFTRYIQKTNPAVDAFMADVEKIRKAIDKDAVSGRSPVRMEGNVYKFDLLGERLGIDGKEQALNVLKKLASAAYDESDSDFRALIEKAYGTPLGEEPEAEGGLKRISGQM